MQHVLFSFIVVTLSLLSSIKRHGAAVGYLTLSWTPTALLLLAVLHEKAVGFTRFSEVTYHIAYDTSYLLVIAGLVILLHTVIGHRPKILVMLGSCFSALPILALIISQSR
jgi:hypothetical protein